MKDVKDMTDLDLQQEAKFLIDFMPKVAEDITVLASYAGYDEGITPEMRHEKIMIEIEHRGIDILW